MPGASPDARTWLYCASAGVDSTARIAASVRGRHDAAAVEATAERNCLRDNPLESVILDTFLPGGFRFWYGFTCSIHLSRTIAADSVTCQGIDLSSRYLLCACVGVSRCSSPKSLPRFHFNGRINAANQQFESSHFNWIRNTRPTSTFHRVCHRSLPGL